MKIPVFSLGVEKNPNFVRGGHGDFPPPPSAFFTGIALRYLHDNCKLSINLLYTCQLVFMFRSLFYPIFSPLFCNTLCWYLPYCDTRQYENVMDSEQNYNKGKNYLPFSLLSAAINILIYFWENVQNLCGEGGGCWLKSLWQQKYPPLNCGRKKVYPPDLIYYTWREITLETVVGDKSITPPKLQLK